MEPETIQGDGRGAKFEHYIQLAQMLITDLIENQGHECQSIFNSQKKPNIQLSNFIRRVQKYTQFSCQSLIIGIILLDRYNMANPQFIINQLNAHKFFLTCLLIATKFHDDFYYDNKAFEMAGGVNIAQLMIFQIEFITKIDYQVFVSEEEYQTLLEKLESVYFSQGSEGPDETGHQLESNKELVE